MASVNQTSDAPSPSASLSPPNSSATPPPLASSSPSNSSAPPPQTPPPAIPAAPPPQTPPPAIPAAPPPSPPQSPPPESSPPPSAPPPSTPASPPPSTPAVTPPPKSPTTPPPIANSPPPPILSTPPPSNDSPPPQASPVSPSPVAVSSPPPAVSSSPTPPGEVPSPPSPSPPSPVTPPQERTPPPPALPPPPTTSSQPPPPSRNRNPPPASVGSPPPPSIPSSLPPSVSPPARQGNSSVDAPSTNSSIPTIPTEKPTARTTTPSTDTAASTSTTGGGGLKAGPVAAIGIVVGFLALSLVIFAVWFVQKRKKKTAASNSGFIMPSPSSQNSDSHFLKHQYSVPSPYNSVQLAGSAGGSNFAYSPESGGIGNSRSWFTYEELATATNGFSSNNLLGEGGFGCVYKGVLTDGREVAVKQLKAGGGQGEREFRAEVEIISRIHHRHLVSLVGYCIYEYQRILVYDYVQNDTLHHHLHGESRVMDWAARIKFAAGAARGIAYLHEDCNPRIIHRDIKSANILLDENFEAKVADFGLAKLMELSEQTHVSTRVMGTFGYMAPEYATSGKLTEKSDVFSFGVVLLELITGRKPVDASQPIGDESLVEWARPLMTEALENGSLGDLVDPRLDNFVEGEMFRMIETAAVCVRHSASKRPRMSQVVRALDMIDESGDITNGMKPGQSQIYDSREQSAQIRLFHRMAFGSQGFSVVDSFSNSQSSWKS